MYITCILICISRKRKGMRDSKRRIEGERKRGGKEIERILREWREVKNEGEEGGRGGRERGRAVREIKGKEGEGGRERDEGGRECYKCICIKTELIVYFCVRLLPTIDQHRLVW